MPPASFTQSSSGREIEQFVRGGTGLRARREKFPLQYLVNTVGKDHVDHVEPLARLRPEGLQREHSRAVRLQAHNLAVGQAFAAPVAQGNPWPMTPPVICSQSCGAALCV